MDDSLKAAPPPAKSASALAAADWGRLAVVAGLAILPTLALAAADVSWPLVGLALLPAVLAVGAAVLWLRGGRQNAGQAAELAHAIAAAEQERAVQRKQETQLRQDHARALARAERSFERFFEEAPFGIALIDDKGGVLEGNRAFRHMAGLIDGPMAARQLAELLRSEDRRDLSGRLERLATGGVGSGPLDARLRAGDRET